MHRLTRSLTVVTFGVALVLLCSCGQQSPDPRTPRTDILKATRPAPLPPVDAGRVSKGVDRVGEKSVRLDAHLASVSRANAALTDALRRGADYSETRRRMLTLVRASDTAAAELLSRHFADEDVRDAELRALNKQLSEGLELAGKENTSLLNEIATLQEDKAHLERDLAAKAENEKAVKKHADAAMESHGTVEAEKAAAEKWRLDNQHKVDFYDKLQSMKRWLIAGVIVLVLLVVVFRSAIAAFLGRF